MNTSAAVYNAVMAVFLSITSTVLFALAFIFATELGLASLDVTEAEGLIAVVLPYVRGCVCSITYTAAGMYRAIGFNDHDALVFSAGTQMFIFAVAWIFGTVSVTRRLVH